MSCSGFQSTNRANPLAQKILAADIAQGLNDTLTFYTPDNCMFFIWPIRSHFLYHFSVAFLNNTVMPLTHNYNNPSVAFRVNGVTDQNSQRFFVGTRSFQLKLLLTWMHDRIPAMKVSSSHFQRRLRSI